MVTPTTVTKKQGILDYQRQFWEATKAGDGATLGRLTADEVTFVMNQSVSNHSRDEFVHMMTAGDFKLNDYDIDAETTFREFAPDVAFLAYKVNLDYVMKGERERKDAYYSSIWLKSGDGWRCAVATESRQ
jgi:ketosteroid isomerase-like protein